jgi:hypothetical protein
MLLSNLLAGIPSWVLDSAILLARVNLFLQGDHSVGQSMGGHADSSQDVLLEEVNLIGQGRDMGELKRSRFFTP